MNTGMLWFDNDKKRDLGAKVSRAAQYYRQKYGQTPNLCYVHPAMFRSNGNGNGKEKTRKMVVAGVEVRPAPFVLRNHLWIGRDDEAREHPPASKR